MKVYYFSATGNSLYVAKSLSENLVSIPQAIKDNDYDVIGDVVGFVVPTYYGSIPKIVFEFISEMSIDAEYVFVITTCGKDETSSASYFAEWLQSNKTYVDYSKAVYMTNNHIPLINLKQEIRINKDVDNQITKIKKDINLLKDSKIEGNPLVKIFDDTTRKTIDIINKIIPLDNPSNFFINEKCVKCEICTKVCPKKNIVFMNNKINIGKNCVHCLACIHNCPKLAIGIKYDKSPEVRYRNKNIKLSEIIKANNQR